MILLLMKWCLLMAVFFGFFHYLSFRFQIPNDFLPFFALTSIGSLMFLAGILNIMYETVWIISVFSIAHLFLFFLKNKRIMHLFSPGILFFLLGSLLFAWLLKGNKFFMYDDFSHWGLIARETLLKNRLPNFSDELIIFESYPAGSASFIYFVGKIIGSTERSMLYAQSLLYLSCTAPLFALIQRKKIFSYIIVTFYSVFLFFGNYGMLSLYVDALLSCLVLAITVILFYSSLYGKTELGAAALLVGNAFMISVKNSGLFFAVVAILFFLVLHRKEFRKEKVFFYLSCIFGPFLFKFLWDKHLQMVFANAEESKHSVSIQSYQNIFSDKSPEDIRFITKQIVERSTNLQYVDVRIIFIILIFSLLSVVLLFLNKKSIVNESNAIKVIFGLYFTYQLSLWFMYVFSMPLREAVSLAAYGRYNMTISAYLLGIFIIFVFIKDREKNRLGIYDSFLNNEVFLFLFSGWLFFSVKNPLQNVITNQPYEESPRPYLTELLEENELSDYGKLFLYVSSLTEFYSRDYLYFQYKYELRIKDFEMIDRKDLENKQISINQEKITLIVLKRDELIGQFLNEKGLDIQKSIFYLTIGGADE